IEKGDYNQERIEEWTRRLRTVFNRGFWDGYYLGRTMGEWSERYGSQATENKVFLGTITNYFNKIGVAEARIQTAETLKTGDRFMVTGATTGVYTDEVPEMRVSPKKGVPAVAVAEAHQGDVFAFKTSQPLHRGDKIYRVDTVIDEY
ncbi:MAG: U32 family peptidase, partial [Bacteroidales bacterium]|nr:U32 family peptidase [Candidatus Colimorpha onthohippi]